MSILSQSHYGGAFLGIDDRAVFHPSPVWTLLIRAESLDRFGEPNAVARIHVALERTYDGKLNILEYQILPGVVGAR